MRDFVDIIPVVVSTGTLAMHSESEENGGTPDHSKVPEEAYWITSDATKKSRK
jgi:hypothetical protein